MQKWETAARITSPLPQGITMAPLKASTRLAHDSRPIWSIENSGASSAHRHPSRPDTMMAVLPSYAMSRFWACCRAFAVACGSNAWRRHSALDKKNLRQESNYLHDEGAYKLRCVYSAFLFDLGQGGVCKHCICHPSKMPKCIYPCIHPSVPNVANAWLLAHHADSPVQHTSV